MAMHDHIGPNGIVTNQAIIATLEEETASALSAKREMEANGQTHLAALLGDAVDANLDRINTLRQR